MDHRDRIRAGEDRAWPSIRDSNTSTLITCAVLYFFGQQFGATIIMGFALVLAIGVAVSLFSAIVVTRLFLELLLLPFASRPHTPASVTGILAPLTVPAVPDYGGVRELELTSWRHVGHRPQSIGKRMLRKLSMARGFMVYEGLR